MSGWNTALEERDAQVFELRKNIVKELNFFHA